MRLLALLLAGLVLVGGGAATAGCGGDDTKVVTEDGRTRTVPDVKFAKTRFVVNTGLALGAVRRYIYKPYRAGTFRRGADGRKRAFVKAALAGAFAVNRLKAAQRAALSSDTLRPLADRMARVGSRLRNLATSFRGGRLDPAAILGIGGGLGGLIGAADRLGVGVKERSAPSF